jgi:ribokinase
VAETEYRPTGRVVSLGSILVDLAVDVPRLPDRGGDVLATATRTAAGGGFNLAAAVARQRVPCLYAGPHGTGPYGEIIRAALAHEGIVVAGAARAVGDSGFCVTLVEPDAERTFVTMTGVEAALTGDDLAALDLAAGDVVALSGYDLAYPVSGAVLGGWLGSFPEGVLLAFDPGPMLADIPGDRLGLALRRSALLTLNQREARQLADAHDASGPALLHAVRSHPALGPHTVTVVREGPSGCTAAGGPLGDDPLTLHAPQVEAVDSTGAGDTHTGVLLAALSTGFPLREALARANLAAAISVTRPGSATAPTAAELDTI